MLSTSTQPLETEQSQDQRNMSGGNMSPDTLSNRNPPSEGGGRPTPWCDCSCGGDPVLKKKIAEKRTVQEEAHSSHADISAATQHESHSSHADNPATFRKE